MKPSEVAEACAERLEAVGWHQHNYFDVADLSIGIEQSRPACLVGTMYAVMGFEEKVWDNPVYESLKKTDRR